MIPQEIKNHIGNTITCRYVNCIKLDNNIYKALIYNKAIDQYFANYYLIVDNKLYYKESLDYPDWTFIKNIKE